MTYFRKNPNSGNVGRGSGSGGGHVIPRVLKKQHVEIPGIN